MTAFNLDDYRVPPAAELPADLDPEARAAFEANERRVQVIAGLRNLAQMLVDHPELPVPYSVSMQAGPLGGDWDVQRRMVSDAAERLDLQMEIGRTHASVTAQLSDKYASPSVTYRVHAVRPAEGGTR